jgi:hypothetical protein
MVSVTVRLLMASNLQPRHFDQKHIRCPSYTPSLDNVTDSLDNVTDTLSIRHII